MTRLRPTIIQTDKNDLSVNVPAQARSLSYLNEDAVTVGQAIFRTVFSTLPPLSPPKTAYASTYASRSFASPLFSTSTNFQFILLLQTRLQIYLGSSLKRCINITILRRATHFLNMLHSAFSSLLSDVPFKALSDLFENKRVGAIS